MIKKVKKTELLLQGRVRFLDGVRGWAAVIVLIHHIFGCFLALAFPYWDFSQTRLGSEWAQGHYKDLIVGIVFLFLTNGHLAVLVFFVLSGYALSVGYLKLQKQDLSLACVTRYFRLMIPIFVISFIAYLLLKFQLFFNLDVEQIPENSSEWFGRCYRFEESFKDFLIFSLYDVFFRYTNAVSYSANLWTMSIELLGSFFIYAYLSIFRQTVRVHWRLIFFIISTFLIVKPVYACFMMGYGIAELNEHFQEFSRSRRWRIGFIVLFFGSILVSSFFKDECTSCCMAGVLVLSASYAVGVKTFFSNKISQFLGSISFPLYLIQIPLICSWSFYWYIRLPELGWDRVVAVWVNAGSTIVIAILGSVALLPLEKRSILLSKKLGSLFLKKFF